MAITLNTIINGICDPPSLARDGARGDRARSGVAGSPDAHTQSRRAYAAMEVVARDRWAALSAGPKLIPPECLDRINASRAPSGNRGGEYAGRDGHQPAHRIRNRIVDIDPVFDAGPDGRHQEDRQRPER